jgi:hypothetical protein
MNFVPNFAALNEARARARAKQAEKAERQYQQTKEWLLARLKAKEEKCTQVIQNHYLAHGQLPASPEMFEQCHDHMPDMNVSRFKQEVVNHSDGGLKIFKLEDCSPVDSLDCGWNSRIGLVPRYARTK